MIIIFQKITIISWDITLSHLQSSYFVLYFTEICLIIKEILKKYWRNIKEVWKKYFLVIFLIFISEIWFRSEDWSPKDTVIYSYENLAFLISQASLCLCIIWVIFRIETLINAWENRNWCKEKVTIIYYLLFL